MLEYWSTGVLDFQGIHVFPIITPTLHYSITPPPVSINNPGNIRNLLKFQYGIRISDTLIVFWRGVKDSCMVSQEVVLCKFTKTACEGKKLCVTITLNRGYLSGI